MAKERKMEPKAEAVEAQNQEQGISLEQAVGVITEALEKGNKAGAYTLQEATAITNIWSGITKMLSKSTEAQKEG